MIPPYSQQARIQSQLLINFKNDLTPFQTGFIDGGSMLTKQNLRISPSLIKKITCPTVHLNSNIIPYSNSVRYLGLHLDSRLTRKIHIGKKRNEFNIKYIKMYWLFGKNSQLALKTKVLLYKSILKPIWLYGCQIWGTSSESNLSQIQRAQSKILRGT